MIWVAAALAAGASLLRWAATDSQAHAWSAGTLLALLAAAVQMTLAVVLAGGGAPDEREGHLLGARSASAARATYVVAAVVNAVIILAFLPTLLPGASTEAHGGHGGGTAAGIGILDALRLGLEVALVAVLLWLYRRSRREGPSPARS